MNILDLGPLRSIDEYAVADFTWGRCAIHIVNHGSACYPTIVVAAICSADADRLNDASAQVWCARGATVIGPEDKIRGIGPGIIAGGADEGTGRRRGATSAAPVIDHGNSLDSFGGNRVHKGCWNLGAAALRENDPKNSSHVIAKVRREPGAPTSAGRTLLIAWQARLTFFDTRIRCGYHRLPAWGGLRGE